MSTWLVVLVTLAYCWTALDQGFKGNYGTTVMFAGYAIANIGIINVLS